MENPNKLFTVKLSELEYNSITSHGNKAKYIVFGADFGEGFKPDYIRIDGEWVEAGLVVLELEHEEKFKPVYYAVESVEKQHFDSFGEAWAVKLGDLVYDPLQE